MASLIKRKRKEFKCGVCGRTEDDIQSSTFALKDGVNHKPLCIICAATLRFSPDEHYEVVGHEIRPAI
jgi:hypothetical protein